MRKVRYPTWAAVPRGVLVKNKLLYLIKPYQDDGQPLVTARENGLELGWIVSTADHKPPFKEVKL